MSGIGFPGFTDRVIISRFITSLMEASDRRFSILFFEEQEYSIRRVEIFLLPRFLFSLFFIELFISSWLRALIGDRESIFQISRSTIFCLFVFRSSNENYQFR